MESGGKEYPESSNNYWKTWEFGESSLIFTTREEDETPGTDKLLTG
jgi:hypothetical protein